MIVLNKEVTQLHKDEILHLAKVSIGDTEYNPSKHDDFIEELDNIFDIYLKIFSVTKEDSRAISAAVKTIYIRIKQMESVQDILKKYRVYSTYHKNKNFNVYMTLDNLAQKWNELNHDTKSNLASGIAGRYNSARFFVLMDNWAN
ncbi:hypothetical protein [Oceanobacillus oncorhynchi]|uniref:hypothetical protein n=1 Tax=Oceanobacillus oncorhynchi TaxID=545501 RepID=UPI0034D78839